MESDYSPLSFVYPTDYTAEGNSVYSPGGENSWLAIVSGIATAATQIAKAKVQQSTGVYMGAPTVGQINTAATGASNLLMLGMAGLVLLIIVFAMRK